MKKVYMLEDLDCANCALKMEDGIKKIDGVVNAEVNFMTQKMTIETEADDQKKIMKEVVKVCRKIEPDCTILL
ncbi:MAG: heavy metal-associated domain-containing protein [Eubacteriales bacterium]|nr:heavy-metal-associated domain-containing protein [Clostridiales bacterium]MDD7302894.1 heavy metal-associated domain-containing protein [Eubacteriales bacterium]MDY4433533.1 heavy metal-associated domain-containing protein [Candidatus Flemingibacterium sp.]